MERVAHAWGMTVLGGGFPYRKAVWFTLARAGSADDGAVPTGTGED
ncbi:hypothetical protein ACFYY1_20735 [Streptomyces sp. NPDC001890]